MLKAAKKRAELLLLTMSSEALKTEECLFIEDMLHMALKMKVVFQNSNLKITICKQYLFCFQS